MACISFTSETCQSGSKNSGKVGQFWTGIDTPIANAAAFFERLKVGDLVEAKDEAEGGDGTTIEKAKEVEFES